VAPSSIGTFGLTENWLANTNSTTTLYNVQISTDPTFAHLTDSAQKTGQSASFTNLSAATQYFAQVRALGNNSQYTAFTALPSTFTFILPPGPSASTFTAVDTMNATYNWSLTSSSGTLPQGTAFVAQASTSNFVGGTTLSSTTYNTNATFSGLVPNSTYYFQVESSNTVNVSGFVNMASTTTPAAVPAGLVSGSTATTSVTVSWSANSNPAGTVYELWRDVATGFTAPAKTVLTAVSTSVVNLTPNSTYYFEVRALGNDGHYTAFSSMETVATFPTAPSSAAVTGLGVSSMTANWGANGDPAGTRYGAQISTMATFVPLADSTVTTANAYAFTGLGSNTTYYLQVQALGFGGTNSAQTGLPTTVTYANVPTSNAALNAGLTSVGLSWASGGNAAGTLYKAELSTDTAFGSLTDSSRTVVLSSTFTGLSSNATYYLRVQAINNQGVGTAFTTVTTTSTMVAAPVAAAYTAVSSVSVTANWAANGNAATYYTVNLGTAAFPTAVTASSVTLNLSASFSGLNPSTTYFAEVEARGNDGTFTPFTSLSSTLTFLSAPFGGTFANVSTYAATVGWSSTNGAGTVYLVDISTVASFTPLWSSSSTAALSATFGTGGQAPALGPNVTYYFQVQAQQPSNGQNSLFVSLGSTVTPVNPPSGTTLVNVTSTTYTLNWAPAGNPAGTTFEIWTDVTNGFASPTKKSVTLTTATVSGLANNTTYYFKVRALNYAGIVSAFDVAQSTLTLPPAPGAPGKPAGTAQGVSSITWTWTAATYASTYTVFSASAGVPIGGGAPLTYTETGLSTNTPVGLYVAGDNGSGTGALSPQTTVYTLAVPPAGTTFSNVVSTQALLSWSLNSNPSTTTAELQRSTDDATFTTVFVSTPAASGGIASFLDAGVIGCTTYYYRVRNWNGSGIATGFDSQVVLETTGTTPSPAVGLSASPAANNYIDLSWTQSPTEGIAHYILYTDSGTGTLSPTPLLPVIASTVTSLTVGPFVSSAAYTFRLDAFHRCGIEETTGVTAISPATGTLANVRASVVSPVSGQRINGNAVTLLATLNAGDPTQVSQVTFQYRQHGAGTWTTIPSGFLNAADAATHPNPATSSPYLIHLDADANLVANSSYDVRAVAVNVAGSSDTAPSAVTLQKVMAGLSAPDVDVSESISAGVVTKTVYVNSGISNTLRATGPNASDPAVTILIPGGALTGLSTTTVRTTNIVSISTPGPSGLTGIGNAIEIKVNGQATTYLASGSQASITISYPATQNPSTLQVWAYNETTHQWDPLSTSSLDTSNHTITGLTSHFSIFQIFPTATTVQPDTSKVRVYPVPFRPNSGNPDEGRPFAAGDFRTGIVFDNLPGTASIKIYTLSGRLVDEFDASTTNGKVQWDVRNRDGRDVASGGYFAVISSPGSKTIVRKLLIIR
ncbi:MAG: fibronectin type III domain-containing protein, partial [Elusimicrobia bacterium]|nr:fibronectin type III domain-containing protein [Elusimicrobiota bacterium]